MKLGALPALSFVQMQAVRRLWDGMQASIRRIMSGLRDPGELQSKVDQVKAQYLVLDQKMKQLSLTQDGMAAVLAELLAEGVVLENAKKEVRMGQLHALHLLGTIPA